MVYMTGKEPSSLGLGNILRQATLCFFFYTSYLKLVAFKYPLTKFCAVEFRIIYTIHTLNTVLLCLNHSLLRVEFCEMNPKVAYEVNRLETQKESKS